MNADLQWKKIGVQPHHGILTTLFSLRTKQSCGIGEFLDLIKLIDWCKTLHFDVIQLLPLNDKGLDPSPYNPLSSCALDPVFLSLHALKGADEEDLKSFEPFSLLPRIAFAEVKREKIRWLSRYYQKMGPEIVRFQSYREFVSRSSWLFSYCLFKTLKQIHGGKHWLQWPKEHQSPSESLYAEHREAIGFHAFLQYLCFKQMEEVKAYGEKNHVFIMGDIPILLSPDSADVWEHPSLFELSLSAGAPPDLYNAEGQKWGFPLFNWRAMEQDDYAWWRQRLATAETLYHIYRIDHIVGFFRIWAVPRDKKPKEGFFVPADQAVWAKEGKQRLEIFLKATSMLPVGEDLGTIPDEVRLIMRELGICTTSVIRWERRWENDRAFIPYGQYHPMSLTTVSTPDTDLVKSWWTSCPDEAKAFCAFKGWSYEKTLSYEHLKTILQDSHQTPSRFHINQLQEYLSLFPELVSSQIEDERVNVPGTLLSTNWTSRYVPSIEEMRAHIGLNEVMHSMVIHK